MAINLFEDGCDGLSAADLIIALQWLEDFFHFRGIARAGDCLVSADIALEVDVGDAVVHRMHTEFPACFDDVGDFVDAVFADAVSYGRGAKQYLGARNHTRLVDAPEQRL